MINISIAADTLKTLAFSRFAISTWIRGFQGCGGNALSTKSTNTSPTVWLSRYFIENWATFDDQSVQCHQGRIAGRHSCCDRNVRIQRFIESDDPAVVCFPDFTASDHDEAGGELAVDPEQSFIGSAELAHTSCYA
jgi:hypothetical protein